MAGFRDLGLDASLCDLLESLGYRAPYAFQADAIPVLLRGTATVALASAGSGKSLTYSLAAIQRVDPRASGPQALLLRPTEAQAARTALWVQRLGASRAASAVLLRRERLPEPVTAPLVVATPRSALDAVKESLLKVEGLSMLLLDGLSEMLEWEAGSDLDTIFSLVPKGAQRAAFTSDWGPEVEDWLERHLRRARQLGAGRAGAAGLGAAKPGAAELAAEYVADDAERWVDRVAAALAAARAKAVEGAVVFCRTVGDAGALREGLAVRGFPPPSPGDPRGARVVAHGEEAEVARAASISCGSPPDAGTLRQRCESAARILFVVAPEEVPHLEAAADHGRVGLHPMRAPLPEDPLRSLADLQARLRSAVTERDLAPYLLALEPLFSQFTPAEVAAAAAALLRERAPEAPEAPKVPAWTRLYFAVGRKEGVRPADLVGCITGESGIRGTQVGRIDIRETFSVVEVSADVAERVLRSLANVALRGRAVAVRPFRE